MHSLLLNKLMGLNCVLTFVSQTGTVAIVSAHCHLVMSSHDRLAFVIAVLKEADSVSQPADRVRTLWRTKDKDHDPDPVHIPKRHNTV